MSGDQPLSQEGEEALVEAVRRLCDESDCDCDEDEWCRICLTPPWKDRRPTDELVSREGAKIGPPHVTAVERARDAAQQFGDDDESNVEARLLSDVLHFLQAWTDPDRPTHDDARSDEGGVRVTCANGHTSTFRDLRDESDCTAPCCPRDGCDECSFTFEPSDLFDPMWGDVVFATPLAGGDDGG